MSDSTTATTAANTDAAPLAAPAAPFAGKAGRPASEIFFANAQHPLPTTKHIDRWFESLSQFEEMLEDMARVSLDGEFKSELDTIDDWFSVLAEPERTAALYSLLQHCSDLQVRFFITILQQMLAMDQDPDAGPGAAADAQPAPERHSIAAQMRAPGRMSYDSGPAASGSHAAAGARGAAHPALVNVARTGGWTASNLSSDNLLLGGAKLDAGRPKSSSHEADANADWRLNRTGPTASPTAEHFSHAALGLGAASRRQSNHVLTQQSTPRVSVDMEPKDFRWSSLTESLEPFGNIPDPNASALTHMIDANVNRSSGIAARRSVGSRLSIAVKSPRDTMQQQQQQQLAANLAQMSVAGGQPQQPHVGSPLAASFAQQQPPRGFAQGPSFAYSQLPAAYAGRMQPPALSAASSVATTPVRAAFPRSNAGTPVPSAPSQPALAQSPAALKPQPELADLELVKDIPAWLRSLRLHKYTECFAGMDWTSVVSLSDEQLQAKGVSALGARRKMLKVFEAVLLEVNSK
ncbi:Flap-structured DNA-binding and RNA-binding protein [Coemansia sp. RSA 2702]|nr:Flap-structured DNA-binding and RNA-binding protein [Coemansia sp. RSA 2702]